MGRAALFVGLCTLDVIQLVGRLPAADEKLTARRQAIAAGGPATNAAVTCAALGTDATLLTGLGTHPLAAAAAADLAAYGVRLVDLDPRRADPPPVSSILVTAGTGERAVASTNAAGADLAPPDGLSALLDAADVIELDGHHIRLAREVARRAADAGRLTVLDGGSWKAGTADLLDHVDVAVCSADFHPPGRDQPGSGTPGRDGTEAGDTLRLLRERGVAWSAVTAGPGPIRWQTPDAAGTLEVPAVAALDTLGAGDVFHGAFVHALAGAGPLTTERFTVALRAAAAVAACSCTTFGTRSWLRAAPTVARPVNERS